jgi:hypothetical protein
LCWISWRVASQHARAWTRSSFREFNATSSSRLTAFLKLLRFRPDCRTPQNLDLLPTLQFTKPLSCQVVKGSNEIPLYLNSCCVACKFLSVLFFKCQEFTKKGTDEQVTSCDGWWPPCKWFRGSHIWSVMLNITKIVNPAVMVTIESTHNLTCWNPVAPESLRKGLSQPIALVKAIRKCSKYDNVVMTPWAKRQSTMLSSNSDIILLGTHNNIKHQ